MPDGLHPNSNGYQIHRTPVILHEMGATNHLTAGAVMHRGKESLSGQTYLTFTYDHIVGTRLAGTFQTSADLDIWRDGSSHITEQLLSNDGLIQTIKARSLVPIGSGKEFIRLKVVRTP